MIKAKHLYSITTVPQHQNENKLSNLGKKTVGSKNTTYVVQTNTYTHTHTTHVMYELLVLYDTSI